MAKTKSKASYILVDTETTGLSVTQDRILEIAALRFEGTRCVDRFVTLIQTDHPCSEDAFSCHQITPEELQEKGLEEREAFSRWVRFIGDLPIVAHYGLGYDFPLILNHLSRLKIPPTNSPLIDTLILAETHLGFGRGELKLEHLGRVYGISQKQAHRAESDCLTTAAVLHKIFEKESNLETLWKNCGQRNFSAFNTLPAPYEELSKALENGQAVRIRYLGKDKAPSDRWIQPIHILVKTDMTLSISALCLEEQIKKEFRLDRILKIFERAHPSRIA